MREIQLKNTLCDLKYTVGGLKEWCPFLVAGKEGIPAKFGCALDPNDNIRRYSSYEIKRLAFCRREFPNGVIVIKAG